MTPNLAYAQEQDQRLQSDLVAVEAQSDKETDNYSLGFWDGKDNDPPVDIYNQTYWAGYCEGIKQYWMRVIPPQGNTAEVF